MSDDIWPSDHVTWLQGRGDGHHDSDGAGHWRAVGGPRQHHRGQAHHRQHQARGRRQLHLRPGEHGPRQHPAVNIARWDMPGVRSCPDVAR